jgi:serine/threonine-protein kinase
MFEPGTQVGRYEIQRRLGRGGMGTVYVAHDPVLGRMVAIKVFAGDLDVPDARERFSREARAAAALNHPNIVTIYDFGEYEAQPFIVMEYVPGETLAGFIRRKTPVSMADKLRWMEELCAGAGYAHQMHLVHRDIKPANLMIDRSGRLKILDFGIARMLGIASNTSVMVGTPGYMAPEQITGEHPVDHRADQFSIGVVFYELLAYTEAFPGDSLPMITHRILTEQPAPLGRLAPDAPPEVIGIIEQTLRKKAAERFPDSESLRVAIARVRREYSSSAAWNAPTIAVGRDTPSPATGSRGTGSSRRRQDEVVGVAQLTPPPDPRRTDREALARRRTAQLEAALQEARVLLAQNQLESALDRCQQALTFDEQHVGALRLEEEIETALRMREELERTSALTVPPSNVSDLLHTDAVTRMPDVAVAGAAPPVPEGIGERTVLRRPTAPPDATIVAPARRTPAPVPPPAPEPPPAARPAAAPQPAAKAPAAKPAPKSVKVAKAPAVGPMIADLRVRLRAIVAQAGTIVGATAPRDRRVIGIGAGVLALVAAIGAYMMTSGPAPTGTVVVDAVPWATVTSIENEAGDPVAPPTAASTPLLLTLPEGSYRIALAGPSSGSQPQQVTIDVVAGQAVVAPVVLFTAVTPEDYFEEYLASPVAPEAPDVAVDPAAPAPTAPAGAAQ